MNPRVRIIGWQVLPIVMLDDGENLTPIPVQPLTVAAKDWQEFKDGGDTLAIDSVRQQMIPPEPPKCAHEHLLTSSDNSVLRVHETGEAICAVCEDRLPYPHAEQVPEP